MAESTVPATDNIVALSERGPQECVIKWSRECHDTQKKKLVCRACYDAPPEFQERLKLHRPDWYCVVFRCWDQPQQAGRCAAHQNNGATLGFLRHLDGASYVTKPEGTGVATPSSASGPVPSGSVPESASPHRSRSPKPGLQDVLGARTSGDGGSAAGSGGVENPWTAFAASQAHKEAEASLRQAEEKVAAAKAAEDEAAKQLESEGVGSSPSAALPVAAPSAEPVTSGVRGRSRSRSPPGKQGAANPESSSSSSSDSEPPLTRGEGSSACVAVPKTPPGGEDVVPVPGSPPAVGLRTVGGVPQHIAVQKIKTWCANLPTYALQQVAIESTSLLVHRMRAMERGGTK